MITAQQALSRIADFSESELRVAVMAAFFEGKTLRPAEMREAEPEEIFIPLLALSESPIRRAVIDGCRDVSKRLLESLSESNSGPASELPYACAHFAALIGVAHPPELHRHTRALLELTLDASVAKILRNPIVRAALAYATNEAEAPFWIPHLDGELIPGYAFQALLKINRSHPRLEVFLASLWRRSLRGEIHLHAPLFAVELSKDQSDPEACVRRVLTEVLVSAPELRERLLEDCDRYPMSKNWKDLIPSLDSLRLAPQVMAMRTVNNLLPFEDYRVHLSALISRGNNPAEPLTDSDLDASVLEWASHLQAFHKEPTFEHAWQVCCQSAQVWQVFFSEFRRTRGQGPGLITLGWRLAAESQSAVPLIEAIDDSSLQPEEKAQLASFSAKVSQRAAFVSILVKEGLDALDAELERSLNLAA